MILIKENRFGLSFLAAWMEVRFITNLVEVRMDLLGPKKQKTSVADGKSVENYPKRT